MSEENKYVVIGSGELGKRLAAQVALERGVRIEDVRIISHDDKEALRAIKSIKLEATPQLAMPIVNLRNFPRRRGNHPPFRHTEKPQSRNELCKCGSGKKFKRCHGI